jgi:hypothetical protein
MQFLWRISYLKVRNTKVGLQWLSWMIILDESSEVNAMDEPNSFHIGH